MQNVVTAVGTTVWTRSAKQVDNFSLYTAWITTHMQDVLGACVVCVQHFVTALGFAPLHPQSTVLITVIRPIYIHPQTTLEVPVSGVPS